MSNKASILDCIKFLFTRREELNNVIARERHAIKAQKRKVIATHLKLCKAHQQEEQRSHYSEHNCDYCQQVRTSNSLLGMYHILVNKSSASPLAPPEKP